LSRDGIQHRSEFQRSNDSFKNFEVMLTKRPIGKWFANTAILATKNRR